jgi:hypothetical protein
MPRANRYFLPLAHHSPLPSKEISTEVRARPTPLLALGLRGEETLWSVRARLRGHIQPHSSCRKYAAHSRAHRAGIQPAQNTQGAFWEDRYHATAIAADEHLHRCLITST